MHDFFMNSYVHIVGSTLAVYVFIVIAIRLFGKKELAQLSVVDLAIMEVDGNISVLSDHYQKKTTRHRKGHRIINKPQNQG